MKTVLPVHTGTYDQQILRRTPASEINTSLEYPLERILQNSFETVPTNLLQDWNNASKTLEINKKEEKKSLKFIKEKEAQNDD